MTISKLARNPYSLAMAAKFLCDVEPFNRFEFGPTFTTLFCQIDDGTHLIIERDDSIAGYLGWVETTDEIAAGWIDRGERLRHVKDGGAAAVTIFYALDPKDALKMIRAAKEMVPQASVYWKRYFVDGRAPASRSVRKKNG
ncbi:MAG: hypothetical protein JXQ91_07850 [Vannielia sp.]|uniref:hypothetical protein n=1 Tax=Vannielia sp. TaxID=2813045 RepID=UPI003B8DABA1